MRVLRNHGVDPTSAGERLDARCVRGCWFELHRQGGCGPAELRLDRGFEEDADLSPGDFLSVSAEQGGVEERLYLGRVEHWEVEYPAGVRVRLGGMVNELGEVFVGGFGGPGEPPPHRFGRTDLFSEDPDRPVQSYEPTERTLNLALRLITHYVLGRTSVVGSHPVEVSQNPPVDSATFRGEESVRSVLKDLAVRGGNVDWGVDAFGKVFFRPGPQAAAATFRAGREVTKLSQTRSRDVLFNRLQITGDYVYDRPNRSGAVARPSHRSRYHFVDDGSLSAFGEHRLRVWLPWVRTRGDAKAFAGPFFERYGRPVTKTLIEAVLPEGSPVPTPWGGPVEVRDEDGSLLAVGSPEAVRVQFDEAVVVRMEVGPEDPRRLWPEPREDERYEVPPRSELSTEEPGTSFEPPGSTGPDGPGPGTSGSGGGSSSVLTSLSSTGSEGSTGSTGSTGSEGSSGSWRSTGSSDWTTWRTWSSSGSSSGGGSGGGSGWSSGSSGGGSSFGGGSSSSESTVESSGVGSSNVGSSDGGSSGIASSGGGSSSGGTSSGDTSSGGTVSSSDAGSSGGPPSGGDSSGFGSSGGVGSSASSSTDASSGGPDGSSGFGSSSAGGGSSRGTSGSSSGGGPGSSGQSSGPPSSGGASSGDSSGGGGPGSSGGGSSSGWPSTSSGSSGGSFGGPPSASSTGGSGGTSSGSSTGGTSDSSAAPSGGPGPGPPGGGGPF